MKNSLKHDWQVKRHESWYERHKETLIENFPKRIKDYVLGIEQDLIKDTESSLFLTGKSGTGKTWQVHKMVLDWHYSRFVDRRNPKFMIVKVPELLSNLRLLINEPEKRDSYISELKRVQLLVLDDLGACNLTDWTNEILYVIIDHRYDEMKTTYYTSNFALDELAELSSDDRLTRRIKSDCQKNIIEFTNEPYV